MSLRVIKDKIGAGGISIIVGTSVAIIGSLATIVINSFNTRITKVEAQTETQIGDIREMKTDIKWIREVMSNSGMKTSAELKEIKKSALYAK